MDPGFLPTVTAAAGWRACGTGWPALDGTLVAGPRAEGGYRLFVSVPLAEESA